MKPEPKPGEEAANKKNLPKEWHPQQAKLLKDWAEIASSYRWMHNQAYNIYRKKNLSFMLPLIIMSTVAGTANFAQTTFPDSIRPYVPQIIGAINLIAAIMTTIYQFLKISEFMESHRISSINYGKLARTLTVELNLPIKDRNSGGAECVKNSRTEIDRLIEQSPAIPVEVLLKYEREFTGKGLSEPEIVVINRVDIYEDKENRVVETISQAGVKFRSVIDKMKKPLFQIGASNSPVEKKREAINNELNQLNTSKLVSMIDTKQSLPVIKSLPNIKTLLNIKNLQGIPAKKPVVLVEPVEGTDIREDVETGRIINEPEVEINKVADEVVEELVDETVQVVDEPVQVVDELEELRKQGIVSGKNKDP
jgi:hypothetical protein